MNLMDLINLLTLFLSAFFVRRKAGFSVASLYFNSDNWTCRGYSKSLLFDYNTKFMEHTAIILQLKGYF
jgi:hypothetical protein